MIDTNLERNTVTDPLDESVRFADIVRDAISNDFIIKYNNITTIPLGFYYSQFDSKYFKNENRGHIEITHYFFLENSDFEYYKDKRKDNDKYLENWLLNNSFFKHYNIPKNKDFYLIWRAEIYLDKQLYKTYDQKIKFVYRK